MGRILELETQLNIVAEPLTAKNHELERELADAIARPRSSDHVVDIDIVTAPLKARILELERQLDDNAAPLETRIVELERQLAEAIARPRTIDTEATVADASAAVAATLRSRIVELENQLSDVTAPSIAKNADLERQLAEAFVRPRAVNGDMDCAAATDAVAAPLKARIVQLENDLEKSLAPLRSKNAELERQLAEAFARPRFVNDSDYVVSSDNATLLLKNRIVDLEGQLSESLAKVVDLEAQFARCTCSRGSDGGHGIFKCQRTEVQVTKISGEADWTNPASEFSNV